MVAVLKRLREKHRELAANLDIINEAANVVAEGTLERVVRGLDDSLRFLTDQLIPHARAEEEVLYRGYDQLADSPWATDTMRRDHVEVARLAHELRELRFQLATDPLTPVQKHALQQLLNGLHAILKLHFYKEEALLLPRLEEGFSQEAADRLLDSLDQVEQVYQMKRVAPPSSPYG